MELLDLSTVVERDTVNLKSKRFPNGKQYELLKREELGLYDNEVIVKRNQKIQEIGKFKRKLTLAETRTRDKAFRDVLELLFVKIEPDVLAEIEPLQAARILQAWSAQDAKEREEAATPQ